jgi:hypothetical protein
MMEVYKVRETFREKDINLDAFPSGWSRAKEDALNLVDEVQGSGFSFKLNEYCQSIHMLVEAMEIQENRLSGASHLSQEAFRPIWEEAIQDGWKSIAKLEIEIAR